MARCPYCRIPFSSRARLVAHLQAASQRPAQHDKRAERYWLTFGGFATPAARAHRYPKRPA